MIPLQKSQMRDIEFLLSQSMNGIHLLFDNPSIARILANPTEDLDFFSLENLNRVKEILTKFVAQRSLIEKKHFLENLDEEGYEILLRSYFNILDNSIFQKLKFKH